MFKIVCLTLCCVSCNVTEQKGTLQGVYVLHEVCKDLSDSVINALAITLTYVCKFATLWQLIGGAAFG